LLFFRLSLFPHFLHTLLRPGHCRGYRLP
jgi:hypothetical protein